ncbi:endonuclease [Mesonia sp. K7]|uniref:endonuclease n=1 Tax=Mesonia sp. K7 TaxID=2218606 RepID=UPI000DA7481F|nr:endonuclease [Mesonia sp. K7]PZD79363.1 endonuclease I [Mesonia sp. K7]
MKNIVFSIFFLCFTLNVSAQLVINELDSDTPSTDDKEFLEIKSATPNFSLNGYIVVFFNGSASGNNSSYLAYDLAGYTTDANGLLLMGSNLVSPFPQYVISPNVFQNGADAVAIYQDNINNFPPQTIATTTNLIDALVYGTGDPDDTDLMVLLGETQQIDENLNNDKDNESIQLNASGGYDVKAPTPRQLNDGSGIMLNGITISVAQTQYDEGDNFDITFTLEEDVTQSKTVNFTLNNAGFDAADFTGNTSVTFATGTKTAVVNIQLIDDTLDEGDEQAVIELQSIPSDFIILNNEITVRIVDNDFQVAPWGTPTNPTFIEVNSTAPNTYYDAIDGLAGQNLRDDLQGIIAEEGVVRAQTYADVYDILMQADQNPENSNQVWLVYTEQPRAKLDVQTGSDNTGKWNREHVYPRSRGGYDSIEDDDFADGPNVYWNTNADSLRHGNSDAHHIRAVDGIENSIRGNQHFGQYNGPQNNQGSFKGDVARSIFYMVIRYNGLDVVNGFPENGPGEIGDLATLLTWHQQDPPDDFEMNRNNVVYEWQKNRNPFIDYPDLVDYIFGSQAGNPWNNPVSTENPSISEIKIYPNPSSGKITIDGVEGEFELSVYSVMGQQIEQQKITGNETNLYLPVGVYVLKIENESQFFIQKLVIK